MTIRDHILGWHHAAQLIADSMPAPVKPCPVRLVPVTERVGVSDVDPAKAPDAAPAAAPAAALGDGWIEWGGGKCPVEPGTAIEVRFRDLSQRPDYDFTEYPNGAFWRHDGMDNDIVAYRLIPTEAA
jgi:hypothetical protein